MNAKAKGTRAEHRCMKDLQEGGWLCTRAGASLGAFDVIALHPIRSVALFIQVKSGTSTLRRADRKILESYAPKSDDIFVEYWHWNREWDRVEHFDWRTRTWIPLSGAFYDAREDTLTIPQIRVAAPTSVSLVGDGNSSWGSRSPAKNSEA